MVGNKVTSIDEQRRFVMPQRHTRKKNWREVMDSASRITH